MTPRLRDLSEENGPLARLARFNYGLAFLLCCVAGIGAASLYSAAGGALDPWASRHLARFGFALTVLLVVALIDVRRWYDFSYILYGIGLVLLLMVEIIGQVGMGAQRWIDLGFMRLQPSELMKIAVVMALARYYQGVPAEDAARLKTLVIPVVIVLLPVGLVLLQPDLGTSLMIVMAAAAVIFVAGAPVWLYLAGIISAVAAVPVAWQFLHDYQKQRVLTFLDPSRDPLGAGYHITQSKIAIGSGGIEGKGFLEGTQSRLNFLPEKQTDFIFTLWVEETGLIGGIIMILLLGAIMAYGYYICFQCKHIYGRLLVFGLTTNFALYAFINISMVMGLIPVVGAPLPLVSYGGTAMLAAMISFGLICSTSGSREIRLGKM